MRTQVIGFRNGRVLSMPLEETDGIAARRPDSRTQARRAQDVRAGQLLGRVLDGFGQPFDASPPIEADGLLRPVRDVPPGPLEREHIDRPAGNRNSRDRRLLPMRQRTARRHFRRQRRRQEHAAGRDGTPQRRRRHA